MNSFARRKIFFRPAFCCVVGCAVAYAAFLASEPILTKLLSVFVDVFISRLNHVFCGIFIVLVSALYVIRRIFLYHKKKRVVSFGNIAFLLFWLLVYIHYRFCDDTFVFWTLGKVAYMDVLFILPLIYAWGIKNYKVLPVTGGASDDAKDAKAGTDKAEKVDVNAGTVTGDIDKLLSDTPITNAKDDIFDFTGSAMNLLDDLKDVDIENNAFSIGINAPWGCGKSSFLNILSTLVEERGDIVVRFFPRASKNTETIQKDFLDLLCNELSVYHCDIKRIIREYAVALQVVPEGNILSNTVRTLSKVYSEPKREDINDVIRKLCRRIYVIIEDLDRLTGKEIMEVLKIIDTSANFCNTVFVSAYDKNYVNKVIGREIGYADSEAKDANDYTDKYFTLEFNLPPQTTDKLKKYYTHYVTTRIFGENGTPAKELENQVNSCAGYVVESLKTLRHIKRFLNIFVTRYPMVMEEVNGEDFTWLTLLRYMDLPVYDALSRGELIERGNVFGGSNGFFYLRKNYEAVCQTVSTGWENTVEVVKKMFKTIEESYHMPFHEMYHRICHVNSFYVYFSDYYQGELRYKELLQLFDEKEGEKAYKLLKDMFGKDRTGRISEFLRSRTWAWIGDERRFERLLKLCVYGISLNPNDINLKVYMMGLLSDDEARDAVKAKIAQNKEDYSTIIENVFRGMATHFPKNMGYFCIEIADQINDKRFDECIISRQQLIVIILLCQERYYSEFDSNGRNYSTAIELAKVNDTDNKYYEKAVREKLIQLMNRDADGFSKHLIQVAYYHERAPKQVYVKTIYGEALYKTFTSKNAFENWSKNVSDDSCRFFLNLLYGMSHTNYTVEIPIDGSRTKYSIDDLPKLKILYEEDCLTKDLKKKSSQIGH